MCSVAVFNESKIQEGGGGGGSTAACRFNTHGDVAKVSRRQRSELLLPNTELSAARVYLLHHYRLAAALTDGLHSHNIVNV